MKKLLLVLLMACARENVNPTATGCWTGVDKSGARKLIGCYTQAQVVAAEDSQSWSSILVQYNDLKYEANQTCAQCQQKYK